MKNETHRLELQSQNLVARNKEDQKATGKDFPDAYASLFQRILKVQPLPTTLVFHCVLLEDNTVWCKELCQKLPSTPQGDLDLEKLSVEIAARKYLFPLK